MAADPPVAVEKTVRLDTEPAPAAGDAGSPPREVRTLRKPRRGAVLAIGAVAGLAAVVALAVLIAARDGTPDRAGAELEIAGEEIAGIPVSIDGQVVGRAPLTVDTPPAPSRHLVEVKRDGYLPYAEWVEVEQGERNGWR